MELVPQEIVRLKYSPLPAQPAVSRSNCKLDLQVIFTDLPKTTAALAAARTLARDLGARITLMAAQIVPYPLPLAEPDVPVEFTERVMESLAVDNEAAVEIYLCRDRDEAIRRALPPNSLVILGARKWRWWPSWESRLARLLRHDGQRVLVVTI
jgi:hypothetical protein